MEEAWNTTEQIISELQRHLSLVRRLLDFSLTWRLIVFLNH